MAASFLNAISFNNHVPGKLLGFRGMCANTGALLNLNNRLIILFYVYEKGR